MLLIADLLARAAELRKMQALVAWSFHGGSAGLEHTASTLNIHPPATLADPADVHVTADGAPPPDDHGGIEVRVAGARGPSVAGHDPLATRLALLSYPYQQRADLTEDGLAEAGEAVGQWRRQVAVWAESPSGRVPELTAATLGDAFDGLDTSAIIGLLHALESDDMPPGAKFETFMLADRVLGLDLAREIGRIASRD